MAVPNFTAVIGSPLRCVRELSLNARTALMQLMRGDHIIVERTAAHWRLLARFLAHHVVDGGSLKSLTFLEESLRGPE